MIGKNRNFLTVWLFILAGILMITYVIYFSNERKKFIKIKNFKEKYKKEKRIDIRIRIPNKKVKK